ncbi:MAG: type I restriction endonuclease [Cyanobacteria bacterium P01_E01_bin.48]
MDFIDRVKSFASTVPEKLESIKTEEATKHFLIMPFIQMVLGYNAFDPNEVMPEYDANVGAAKKYKIDYEIFQDGQPAILIECKCYGTTNVDGGNEWGQLFHYFSATEARIGILTDGVRYKFYADLIKQNQMDKKPFLELDLLSLNETSVRELSKLTKSAFNIDEAITAASELKYVGGIKSLLTKQTDAPDHEFVRFFFRELCRENNFAGQLKDDFIGYTKRALEEFIREEIENLLNKATGKTEPRQGDKTDEEEPLSPSDTNGLDFTEDEREGYYILRSILCQVVNPDRITYKDTAGYCNILLDGNTWRQIVRLHFNNPNNRKLEIFSIESSGKKVSELISISSLNGIYQYADKFKAIVAEYDGEKVSVG